MAAEVAHSSVCVQQHLSIVLLLDGSVFVRTTDTQNTKDQEEDLDVPMTLDESRCFLLSLVMPAKSGCVYELWYGQFSFCLHYSYFNSTDEDTEELEVHLSLDVQMLCSKEFTAQPQHDKIKGSDYIWRMTGDCIDQSKPWCFHRTKITMRKLPQHSRDSSSRLSRENNEQWHSRDQAQIMSVGWQATA